MSHPGERYPGSLVVWHLKTEVQEQLKKFSSRKSGSTKGAAITRLESFIIAYEGVALLAVLGFALAKFTADVYMNERASEFDRRNELLRQYELQAQTSQARLQHLQGSLQFWHDQKIRCEHKAQRWRLQHQVDTLKQQLAGFAPSGVYQLPDPGGGDARGPPLQPAAEMGPAGGQARQEPSTATPTPSEAHHVLSTTAASGEQQAATLGEQWTQRRWPLLTQQQQQQQQQGGRLLQLDAGRWWHSGAPGGAAADGSACQARLPPDTVAEPPDQQAGVQPGPADGPLAQQASAWEAGAAWWQQAAVCWRQGTETLAAWLLQRTAPAYAAASDRVPAAVGSAVDATSAAQVGASGHSSSGMQGPDGSTVGDAACELERVSTAGPAGQQQGEGSPAPHDPQQQQQKQQKQQQQWQVEQQPRASESPSGGAPVQARSLADSVLQHSCGSAGHWGTWHATCETQIHRLHVQYEEELVHLFESEMHLGRWRAYTGRALAFESGWHLEPPAWLTSWGQHSPAQHCNHDSHAAQCMPHTSRDEVAGAASSQQHLLPGPPAAAEQQAASAVQQQLQQQQQQQQQQRHQQELHGMEASGPGHAVQARCQQGDDHSAAAAVPAPQQPLGRWGRVRAWVQRAVWRSFSPGHPAHSVSTAASSDTAQPEAADFQPAQEQPVGLQHTKQDACTVAGAVDTRPVALQQQQQDAGTRAAAAGTLGIRENAARGEAAEGSSLQAVGVQLSIRWWRPQWWATAAEDQLVEAQSTWDAVVSVLVDDELTNPIRT